MVQTVVQFAVHFVVHLVVHFYCNFEPQDYLFYIVPQDSAARFPFDEPICSKVCFALFNADAFNPDRSPRTDEATVNVSGHPRFIRYGH